MAQLNFDHKDRYGSKTLFEYECKIQMKLQGNDKLILTTFSTTTISSSSGPEVCGPSFLHSGVLYWKFLRSTALGGKFSNPFWLTIPAYY